ncbi:purine-cytosine permease family protein [Lactovum miscens]|uniref:NCS1 nucleoside transporter family n=1 Tax=Lactovum miscens TaxID=190387 RepID=A0A841C8L1_9LACT|nr:cytosine permease [Lactovum miscens]MBB5888684.1 NCS1 nucleoside transporter family [Lactovum miscens]
MEKENKNSSFTIEQNGINVIDESERKGKASSLFWPWFAANISVLSVAYGAFVLGFGLNFWQALIAAVIGALGSFLLVGFISLSGKRGSAPTMVLSRAAFGVKGNILPGIISWVLLVGWETVLVVLSTLATATVFQQLGWASGNMTKVIAFIVVIVIIVGTGVLGLDAIMNVQKWLTIILSIVTIGYFILSAHKIDLSSLGQLKAGSWQATVGAGIMVATALGLGWINSAADYSRYLPRKTSGKSVVGWTTFGGTLAPVILIFFGLLLVASQPGGVSSKLGQAISADPIGALATILPTWYLIPFIIVAVGSLVSGAVMDIYSSGLTLLSLGLPIKRWVGTCIDGIVMFLGTIAIVWFSKNFVGPFEAFLGFVGVPISVWGGIFLGDFVLRQKDYDEKDLFDENGRYGSVNWIAIISMIVSTFIGWGLTMQSLSWLSWLGFLFKPLHLDINVWGYSGLGIIIALIFGFFTPFLNIRRIKEQESK